MPLEVQYDYVKFPVGTGRRGKDRTVSFSNWVRTAGAAINSFELDYQHADHHIKNVEIRVWLLDRDDRDVKFQVVCNYRDKNADDEYSANVTVMVFADTVPDFPVEQSASD